MPRHASVPQSIASSLHCPSMHCPSLPHKPADLQSKTGRQLWLTLTSDLWTAPLSRLHLFMLLLSLPAPAAVFSSVPIHPPSSSSMQPCLPILPQPTSPQARYQSGGGPSFSLAAVHQELQMLQRQLGHSDSASDYT